MEYLLFSRSVSDSVWPHGLQHARLPCPSPSPRVCSNSCPLSRWCHPTISSSVVPFSCCPQSFPASVSFPMSRLNISKYWIGFSPPKTTALIRQFSSTAQLPSSSQNPDLSSSLGTLLISCCSHSGELQYPLLISLNPSYLSNSSFIKPSWIRRLLWACHPSSSFLVPDWYRKTVPLSFYFGVRCLEKKYIFQVFPYQPGTQPHLCKLGQCWVAGQVDTWCLVS